MTDREAFVSRLILEAETPLERAAVTELQIAGLELERLRAIESDRDELLAWIRRLEPRPAYESTLCPVCLQPIKRYWQEGAPHLPGCPWLRATQEVQP